MAEADVGDGSANLGGEYEKLLATVGNLQGDLQRTVGVCQTLGSQNDKLKSNYEAVHVELLQLREKHNSTRAQLLEAVESRVEADQRTETLVHKWKVQLEARTRELEALQAKLVPQDLDMLRAKVQEGLEVPHQRRVVGLEAEVDKYRQMFFNVRREHERCKAEYEQYTIDQGKEMESLHQQRKAEAHALKMRVQELEGTFADAAREDEARLLRRQLEDAEAAKTQLHAEIAAVRSQKEAAEVERHKMVLVHRNELASAHVQATNLEADKQTLQRRCADAEDLARRRRQQTEEARDRLQETLDEVSALKQACAGKDRVALDARAEARHASERLATEWGREKAELKTSNEVLTKRIASAERRCREVSEQMAERVRGAQHLEERTRRETSKDVGILRDGASRLEANIEKLKLESERAGSVAQQEIQRLRGDADRAKSEASRVLREKEALRERVAALQSAADRATEATETMAHARDQVKLEAMTAASKAQQERDKLVEAEDEIDGLRTRVQMLEEEFALLTAEADQAREAHVHALKDIKRAACAERESHTARAQHELEALRRRARRTVHKERKRSRAYKAQAIEAYKRGQRARQVLQTRASAIAAASAAATGVGAGSTVPLTGLPGVPGGEVNGRLGQGRAEFDSVPWTFDMVLDGPSAASARALEELELGQALQRVRASRLDRHRSGDDRAIGRRRRDTDRQRTREARKDENVARDGVDGAAGAEEVKIEPGYIECVENQVLNPSEEHAS